MNCSRTHLRAGIKKLIERLDFSLQGTGANGLRRALALLYERRGKCSGAVPILVGHDELAVECPEGQVKEVMRFVEEVMVARMDYVLNGTGSDGLRVPVEVEVEMVET